MNKTTMLKSMHKLKTVLKGTVQPRIKIGGAVNCLDCFCTSCWVLEILHIREAGLLSSIMELDGTQLAVLKAPKNTSDNQEIVLCVAPCRNYLPMYLQLYHGIERSVCLLIDKRLANITAQPRTPLMFTSLAVMGLLSMSRCSHPSELLYSWQVWFCREKTLVIVALNLREETSLGPISPKHGNSQQNNPNR